MGEVMDIVVDCENKLGWLPDARSPYKSRAAAQARLLKAMARQSPPVTPADVRLALAWCQRRKQSVSNPSQLLTYVEDARRHAAVPDKPLTQIGQAIRDAIAWELNTDLPDSDHWIARLSRSSGDARAATLDEWKAVGRG